ncbi:lactate utilization protein [Chloroflexota bacterium]
MQDATTESKEWYKEKLARKVIESLEKNNISGFYVGTEEEALEKLISLIPTGSKVGHGGSLTLEQIGVIEALRAGNYNFIDRRRPDISVEEQYKLRKESLFADVFLMSTNALTMDGKLVNIDGIGNRLAALIFGPPKVIIVAGINKVVPDMDAAVHRIKNYVAPIHARRGDRPLPCAKTGNCVDCHAPERFCNAVVTIEHQYQKDKDRITVIIVGKELGL